MAHTLISHRAAFIRGSAFPAAASSHPALKAALLPINLTRADSFQYSAGLSCHNIKHACEPRKARIFPSRVFSVARFFQGRDYACKPSETLRACHNATSVTRHSKHLESAQQWDTRKSFNEDCNEPRVIIEHIAHWGVAIGLSLSLALGGPDQAMAAPPYSGPGTVELLEGGVMRGPGKYSLEMLESSDGLI